MLSRSGFWTTSTSHASPELIEAAKKATGSDAATAKALGVTYQEVSNWRHGRRTCPPDMRARMAAMCGLDPVAEAIEALAEGLNDANRCQDAERKTNTSARRTAPPGDVSASLLHPPAEPGASGTLPGVKGRAAP